MTYVHFYNKSSSKYKYLITTMIICNANCSIFNRCKDKIPQQVCIYDLGLQEEKEDDLEKMFEENIY